MSGRSRSLHGERGLKFQGLSHQLRLDKSLPTWGAWIEMRDQNRHRENPHSRSLHGERGLKCIPPSRRAAAGRRSLHGERGLKLGQRLKAPQPVSRSLHGERGLKCPLLQTEELHQRVAPYMGSVD